MPELPTVQHRFGGLPVRTVRAVVVEGPNRGFQSSQGESLSVGTAAGNDMVLTDSTVSRFHLELACRSDEILVVDHGSMNGTLLGTARIERAAIVPGTVLRLGKTSLRVEEGEGAVIDLHETSALGGIHGSAPAMRRIMALAARAAKSDSAVLLVGESGTGKEVFASAIHRQGSRANKPFVTVDCGALSATLISSELFGHEKGSFTGATGQHQGAFERAQGGTLFLDEIGELPTMLQPVLLGVLERRAFRRVGGKTDLAVDVRVIAATNRDLRAEVNSAKFRLDLYFRLAVLRIEVPPLRDHPEDIPLLVEHFLRELDYHGPPTELIPSPMVQQLLAHRWPGNVRELRNFVEATVALGQVAALDTLGAPLPSSGSELLTSAFAFIQDLPYAQSRQAVVGEFEERYLRRLLERASGNVSTAAKLADMDRSYLLELLRRRNLK